MEIVKIELIRQINFSFETNTIKKNLKIALSKIKLYFLAFLLGLFIYSCASQSKESYLEDYGKFMSKITEENKNYNEKEWAKMEEKYKKFSIEWREKFKDDFTLKEEITLKKYEVQFNVIKIKIVSSGYFNNLFN